MRKLSGLLIVAAVTGLAWWQIPQTTGRPLSAQTGQPAAGSSTGLSALGASRSKTGAYKQSAQRLMRMAMEQAQKGNVAEARRFALTAARYQVTWDTNETSPQQLLQQLGGTRSNGLNPAAIASRQLQPTRPTQAPNGLRPIQQSPQSAMQSDPFDLSNQTVQTGPQNFAPTQSIDSGAIRPVAGQQFASQPAMATAPATPAGGNVDPIRARVDDYMQRAWNAWQQGDRNEAIRLASVADLLGESVTWRAGEPTPAQFIARVRSGKIDPQQPIALNPPRPVQPVQPAQLVQPAPASDSLTEPTPLVMQQVGGEQPAETRRPVVNPLIETPEPIRRPVAANEPALEPLPEAPFTDSKPPVERPLTAALPELPSLPEVLPQPSGRFTEATPLPAAAPQPAFTPKAIDPQALADSRERKQYAASLLTAAREDIRSNRLEAAYEKALMASEFDVAWTLFEETPEQVVAEIQRRQKQSVSRPALPLASTQPTVEQPIPMPAVEPQEDPFAPPKQAVQQAAATLPQIAPQPAAQPRPLTEHEYALQLVAEARQLMREGRFDEARAAALKAQAENVSYGLFEDRPELVLRQLDRLSGTVTLTEAPTQSVARTEPKPQIQQPGPATAEKAGADQKHAEAQQLLAEARNAIKDGDLEAAKALVREAQRLGVTYRPFDETPDVVLADIARLQSGATMPDSVPEISEPAIPMLPDQVKPAASVAQNTASSLPATNLLPDASPFDTKPSASASGEVAATSAKPATTTQGPSNEQRAAQAAELLSQARQLIKDGQLKAARQKALEADKLEVIYDLFADQPRDVLAEIARIENTPSRNTAATQARTVAQTDPAPVRPAAETAAPASDARREQAQVLLELAREEVAAGRLDQAQMFAQKVRDMNLTFGPYELQPDTILAEIAEAKINQSLTSPSAQPLRRQPEPVAAPPAELPASITIGDLDGSGSFLPQDLTPAESMPSDLTPAVGSFTGDNDPYDNITAIHPSGVSAEALFNDGQSYLRRGNREAAYQAFLEAWQSGQRLDAYKSQQLQDYLRELNPRRSSQIQLTSGEIVQADGAAYDEATPIDIASQRDQLRFDRLRSEVLNAMLRADSLKERRPDEAIEVLDQAMAEVENSGFETQQLASLVRQLQRSRGSIEGFMAQRAPVLDQQRRNEEIKQQIKIETGNKVRIEKEFAALVDEFNRLFKQRRYAEAQVIAKQAEEIDPTNPAAVNMTLKSKFAYRVDSNEKLRENKEQSFWKQLDDVEQAAIVRVNDDHPMVFGDDWETISKLRKGRYGNDNREWTEEEKRIQKSLSDKVSLHFEDAPLMDVIRYIKTAAGINVVIDTVALEEEGFTTNTPVTIDVDNIMVKSALNLMLQPMGLGYSIENEALNITSSIRQQGKLTPAAYPVADLVVSLRGKTRGANSGFTDNVFNASSQMSVGAGGVQNAGQFQVPPGGPAGGPYLSNGNGMQASVGNSTSKYDFDTLIDLITSVVEPSSWSEVGGSGTIVSNETTLSLVIRQTQQVHQEISDLLNQLRRLQDLQVTIEVRLVSVSDKFFERIGIDFDFNVQDTVGGPDFSGTSGSTTGGTGGNNNNNQSTGPGNPLPPFGSVIGSTTTQQGQQGQTGQQGQQNQQGQTQSLFFTQPPRRELTNRDNYNGTTIVGLQNPGAFTPNLDIAFQQGSFDIGVPDFGNFMPNAGMQVGLAILSDIETFFFIQAAQADERSNLLFAPKVTLFNGDQATIFDSVNRPFVIGLTPTVGAFSVGFTPQISFINDGITLSVTAVISADRRFVRLALAPFFNQLIEVQTFSFLGGAGAGGGGGGLGGGGGGGLGGGGGGFGGGGGGGGFGGGGLGGGLGGGFGVGGIGGGPSRMMNTESGTGRFGQAISGFSGMAQVNPQMGFGGIGGGGFGGGGGGGGGFGGGQRGGGQRGNQGGLGGITATVQQPVIAQISVQTAVSVPDGGTVLLGGVKRLREGRNMAGVPILNKIPYISRLFKNSGVGRETESLMLMVTPRIVIHEEEEELLGIEVD
ncbi:hypothetical protein GC176_04480 [bacterium]|nr:hypothetical protein [bacterium]